MLLLALLCTSDGIGANNCDGDIDSREGDIFNFPAGVAHGNSSLSNIKSIVISTWSNKAICKRVECHLLMHTGNKQRANRVLHFNRAVIRASELFTFGVKTLVSVEVTFTVA